MVNNDNNQIPDKEVLGFLVLGAVVLAFFIFLFAGMHVSAENEANWATHRAYSVGVDDTQSEIDRLLEQYERESRLQGGASFAFGGDSDEAQMWKKRKERTREELYRKGFDVNNPEHWK